MPSRSSSKKSNALLAQGDPYETSWDRVQEATLASEALYRLRPEFREEERQLFEKLHGKNHLSLQDPERRKVHECYWASVYGSTLLRWDTVGRRKGT